MLNGAEVKLTAEGMVPPLPPKVVGVGGADLVFPPLSYGYIVLPDVMAPACLGFRSKSASIAKGKTMVATPTGRGHAGLRHLPSME